MIPVIDPNPPLSTRCVYSDEFCGACHLMASVVFELDMSHAHGWMCSVVGLFLGGAGPYNDDLTTLHLLDSGGHVPVTMHRV